MNEKDRLVELIRVSLMKHIGKSCSLAENIVADLIASGVTIMSGWISVEERLPEECDRFLVYGSRGGIYIAEFRKFSDFGDEYPHWHKLNSKNHYCKPTHWMPLPEPPKEENNNA